MTTNPALVREWLGSNHPKSLALLDKFEIELRLGRLSRRVHKGSADRRLMSVQTVELVRQMIGSTRWKTPAELMALLRGLGQELHAAGGFREPAIGNVVRRIMAAVREEVMTNTGDGAGSSGGQPQPQPPSLRDGRRSLESMLWALPQHVKSLKHRSRSESLGDALEMLTDLPPPFYQPRPDLKQAVMEAIQEIMSDLEDLHKNISDHAPYHIHTGEIILTYGRSKTVEKVRYRMLCVGCVCVYSCCTILLNSRLLTLRCILLVFSSSKPLRKKT
jgi:translation initiation factor eIF-2B subunit beta